MGKLFVALSGFVFLFWLKPVFGQSCVEFNKTSKMKNPKSNVYYPVLKGEVFSGEISSDNKVSRLNTGKQSMIFLSKEASENQVCFSSLNQCVRLNKNKNILKAERKSDGKPRTKVRFEEGDEFTVVSRLTRKNKFVYRIMDSSNQYFYQSERNISKDFIADCGASPSNESKDKKVVPFPTQFGILGGAGLSVTNSKFEQFIDPIEDPTDVKEKPNPIVTQLNEGQAFFVSGFYERSQFFDRLRWRIGVEARQSSLSLDTLKNPATETSTVDPNSLEKGSLEFTYLSAGINSGLFYLIPIGSSQIKTGLGIFFNYLLDTEFSIPRRVGASKLTADESTLVLDTIEFGLYPSIEFHLKFGLFLGASYRYVIDGDANLDAYLGFAF